MGQNDNDNNYQKIDDTIREINKLMIRIRKG